MPELRIDPVCGRRVYIAEDRAGRPSDYAHSGDTPSSAWACLGGVDSRRTSEAKTHDACPFCAGHEAATPIESAAVRDGAGQWQVRVVPNKYPAVAALGADASTSSGAHEVIIESPRHLLDVTELAVDQLAMVLGMYRDRLRHWAADVRLRHAVVFKNSGHAAGASLEHVHSQLVALPYVPEIIQAELDGAHRHFAAHRRCAFCDLIRAELDSRRRLVSRVDSPGGGFIAWCAYAGRQPYETWILPERHAARFDALDDAGCNALAVVLQDVLARLHAQFGLASYNLVLHTAPFDDLHRDAYHWHWELIPRTAHLAGLELGAGVFINPVSPEHAAERLRQ